MDFRIARSIIVARFACACQVHLQRISRLAFSRTLLNAFASICVDCVVAFSHNALGHWS